MTLPKTNILSDIVDQHEYVAATLSRQSIRLYAKIPEKDCVDKLLNDLEWNQDQSRTVTRQAIQWVEQVRANPKSQGLLERFLQEFGLSTQEGTVMMCLAEALLRIPDKSTMDALIRDKLTQASWERHIGSSDSLMMNASIWALMLSGDLLGYVEPEKPKKFWTTLKQWAGKSSEPVIRSSIKQAMKILGKQFVMGRTIEEAVESSQRNDQNQWDQNQRDQSQWRYSFDMLGEAALTHHDAERFYCAYQHAITTLGLQKNIKDGLGISIKLSALHPRYEWAQRAQVHQELYPRLLSLIELAKDLNVGISIDAEEASRLELSLDLIERLSHERTLAQWDGLGVVVQAYQKRALPVLQWLMDLAKNQGRRWMVRLVKGAYWDSEIKWAQESGVAEYPVFTRKCNTDASYLTCAQFLLKNHKYFYPQFATHNAHTVAAILNFASQYRDFEFQRLHGMGRGLYDCVLKQEPELNCRIYAPVGQHQELLPYLVRRLLENGANTSFVNRITDAKLMPHDIVQDPVEKAREHSTGRNHKIPLPPDLYGHDRPNSKGWDLHDPLDLDEIRKACASFKMPSDIKESSVDQVAEVVFRAKNAQKDWGSWPVWQRGHCLRQLAHAIEKNTADFVALLMLEAKKTIHDAIAEIREAVDFCYYYAIEAERLQSHPVLLPGPTGESNHLSYHPRGVFLCISPWNFPMAIFLGQVLAAVAVGNTVVAKPAIQTPKVACALVQTMKHAGFPDGVVQLMVGPGRTLGNALVSHPGIDGVVFTGSVPTAKSIQQTLASKPGPIVPLIAETGGQNVMIIDSSALMEQVVKDVITSSFRSAGQRCSALRVAMVQEDCIERFLETLKGAMDSLNVGDQRLLCTDTGPVIDAAAQKNLYRHREWLEKNARFVSRSEIDKHLVEQDTFYPPECWEIDDIGQLQDEVFGPILHVCRYKSTEFDELVEKIHQTGYGLTLGVHSRIDDRIRSISTRAHVGNIYVNRNMIGAVVGVQPFGGEGLSGTGPKAGGPNYVQRFMVERTLTINTTASGGNATLLCAQDHEI